MATTLSHPLFTLQRFPFLFFVLKNTSKYAENDPVGSSIIVTVSSPLLIYFPTVFCVNNFLIL